MKEIIFYACVLLFLIYILASSINIYYECEKMGGVIVKGGLHSKCIKAEVLK